MSTSIWRLQQQYNANAYLQKTRAINVGGYSKHQGVKVLFLDGVIHACRMQKVHVGSMLLEQDLGSTGMQSYLTFFNPLDQALTFLADWAQHLDAHICCSIGESSTIG